MAINIADSFNRTTAQPPFAGIIFADLTARDAYATTLRYEGMECYVISESMYYSLVGGTDNTKWIERQGGSGSGVVAVADITARNAIPEEERALGMIVQVQTIADYDGPLSFQLVGGITNADWLIFDDLLVFPTMADLVASSSALHKLGIRAFIINLNLTYVLTYSGWSAEVSQDNEVTLTNKDIDGGTASNTSRITIPKGVYPAINALNRKEGTLLYNTYDKKLMVDSGTSLAPVPVFDNLDVFSQDIASDSSSSDWSFSFVGGDSTFLITTSPVIGRAFKVNLNSLFGSESFSLRRTADYAVPHTMRGQRVQMTYDYLSDVGQGQIAWEIVDQTNSVVIVPESAQQAKPAPSGVVTKGFIFFDIPLNCETLRVTLKRPSGAAATISKAFWFNNVELKKFSQNIGPVITDWQSYTPTITNLGSGAASSISFQYRRVGDSVEVHGRLAISAAGSGTNVVTVSLPAGLSVDSTKITNNESSAVGAGNLLIGSLRYPIVAVPGNPFSPNSISFVKAPNDFIAGSTLTLNSQIGFEATIPIQGWSSTARYADYTLNQDVYGLVTNSGSTEITIPSTGVSTKITTLNTVSSLSTLGGALEWDNTLKGFRCLRSGIVDINASVYITSVSAASTYYRIYIALNSTNLQQSVAGRTAPFAGGQGIIEKTSVTNISVKYGDMIYLYATSNVGTTTLGPFDATNLSVRFNATSQQLFAPIGPVVVSASNASGQVIPTGFGGTFVTGWTKSVDTNGAFNAATGEFTSPEDGYYRFFISLLFASASQVINSEYSVMGQPVFTQYTGTYYFRVFGEETVFLAKGATRSLVTYQASGSNKSLHTTGNFLTITKV